jgi:hypothetical protein
VPISLSLVSVSQFSLTLFLLLIYTKSSLSHGTGVAYKFCSLCQAFWSGFQGSSPDNQTRQLMVLLNVCPHMGDILNSRQGQTVTRKCFPSVLLTSLSSSWCRFCRLARFSALETCVTQRKTGQAFNCIFYPFPAPASILAAWQPSPFPLSKRIWSLRPKPWSSGLVLQSPCHQRRETEFSS